MEDNAQLRAENMLLTANQMENNSLVNSKTAEELNLNLYSTVKNKKFNNNNNYTYIKNESSCFTAKANAQHAQPKLTPSKKQNENTNDLFYVPIQQLTKSANINYDLNENSNDRFNFEQ